MCAYIKKCFVVSIIVYLQTFVTSIFIVIFACIANLNQRKFIRIVEVQAWKPNVETYFSFVGLRVEIYTKILMNGDYLKNVQIYEFLKHFTLYSNVQVLYIIVDGFNDKHRFSLLNRLNVRDKLTCDTDAQNSAHTQQQVNKLSFRIDKQKCRSFETAMLKKYFLSIDSDANTDASISCTQAKRISVEPIELWTTMQLVEYRG